MSDQGAAPVSGMAFWFSGAMGMPLRFSGDARCKCLFVHLRALIPIPFEGLKNQGRLLGQVCGAPQLLGRPENRTILPDGSRKAQSRTP